MAECIPDLRQTYVECDGCEDDEEVEWYCTTCKSNLCGKCKTAKLHRKHVIKPWTDPDAVKTRQDAPHPCEQHPGQNYGTYCATCKCVCCPVCVAESHSGHTFATIDSIAETKKAEVEKTLDALQSSYLPQTRSSIKSIETSMHTSAKESKVRKERIKNKIRSLYQQIDQSEKALMVEENKFSENHLDDLRKQLSVTKEQERLTESAIAQMERELSLWNKVRFIKVSSDFPKLAELVPPVLSLPAPPEFQEAKYKLPKSKDSIGHILYSPDEKKIQSGSDRDYFKPEEAVTDKASDKKRNYDRSPLMSYVSARQPSIDPFHYSREIRDIEEFQCQNCGRKFSSENALAMHKVFSCKKIKKGINWKCGL